MSHSRIFSMLVAVGVLVAPSIGSAQARPFLFSVSTAREPGGFRASAYADLAYGHDLFSSLGPDQLESRLGSQVALGRATLLGHLGWAASDDAVVSHVTGQAEALLDVLPAHSSGMLAVGLGARRDYEGTGVALARVAAGYRWARTSAITNLRLERPYANADDSARDGVDLITTFGVARDVSGGFQLGVEAVAEDLEGFVEEDEAEGGAKLMVGPSVRLGPSQARWHFLAAGGPVFRLTESTATNPSPAPRDLTTETGYIIRTSFDYCW